MKVNSQVIGNWDGIRLEQVVGNLLSNAIKYGNSNPIDISTEVDVKNNRATLKVKDHGKGIAPEMLENVFKRFERDGVDQKIPGLGLAFIS